MSSSGSNTQWQPTNLREFSISILSTLVIYIPVVSIFLRIHDTLFEQLEFSTVDVFLVSCHGILHVVKGDFENQNTVEGYPGVIIALDPLSFCFCK